MGNAVPFGLVVLFTFAVFVGLIFAARNCASCDGDCPQGLTKIYTRDGCICGVRPK